MEPVSPLRSSHRMLHAATRRRPFLAAFVLTTAVGVTILVALTGGPLRSSAVQNPSISIDMVTSGNTYTPGDDQDADGFPDPSTNHMAVDQIDNCLTTAAPGNNVQHNHTVHLIVQNVEDLVGWQVRLNYNGGQFRPTAAFNTRPFADTFTGDQVGFANLPIDGSNHRGLVDAASVPAPAPSHQTALIGTVYSGAQSFAVSPDSPQKATHDEANQTYGTTGGGILATLTLQVAAGQAGQASLFMNVDDASPNPPGSAVQVFTGGGLAAIAPPASQLGDGYHGEGATCVALDCVTQECPPVVPSPTPPPTSPPTSTPPPTITPPPGTPTPSPTSTPVPTPSGQFHDAAVKRLRGPSSVRLSPGVPDTSGTVTVVAGNARGDHADLVGVYLALLPPGGSSNFGGCTPANVMDLGAITLLPGDYVTLKVNPSWQCSNPAAVDGMSWTLKAVADVHGDDFGACSSVTQMFSGACAAALASDDSDDFNNSGTRPRPAVVATGP